MNTTFHPCTVNNHTDCPGEVIDHVLQAVGKPYVPPVVHTCICPCHK